jgi:putative hydrolase of the HAD superfamily
MAGEAITKAVLLDSFGTLVRMEPPGPHLRAELERTTGVDVGFDTAERAFGAEIAYYLEHNLEGRDPASLDDLRDRCARVVADAIGRPDLEHDAVREAMLAALRFSAFPDARPALEELRARGLRLVVASNWDCSLPEVLERTGLAPLVHGAVASAVVGAAKPDRGLFEAALELAGCEAAEALHAGDSLDGDVAGARAAGIRPVLVSRSGAAPRGVTAVRSLAELPSLL